MIVDHSVTQDFRLRQGGHLHDVKAALQGDEGPRATPAVNSPPGAVASVSAAGR